MRILFFFDEHPNRKGHGNSERVRSMLRLFQKLGFSIDFVIFKEFNAFGKVQGSSSTFFIERIPKMSDFFSYFFLYKIPKFFRSSNRERCTPFIRKQFEKVFNQGAYDVVIISYAFWSGLIKQREKFKNARIILDMHDFLTAQDFESAFKRNKRFFIGKRFADEVKRIRLFDEVWAISPEEKFIFEHFCKSVKFRVIPHFTEKKFQSNCTKTYDFVYVASDNPFNIEGANWFFKEVFPLLPKDIRGLVIGKISKNIPQNVHLDKIEFADDLTPYYHSARIAICPIFSGSGIKIKVVEALAHGLPIVCTPKGLDGLWNKKNNGCLVTENPFDFAQLIIQLKENEQLYQTLKAEAMQHFVSCYWEDNFSDIL